jgi:hypothetical protein
VSPFRIALLSTIFLQVVLAQNTATASISGRVLSEDGRNVHAIVTLAFAGPRGFPSPPRRAFTDIHGAFTFSKLLAGKYTMCAQIPASDAPRPDTPFVDTCVWGSGQPPVTLAAGQQLTGFVFTAKRGALLKLRVLDPEHVLPQPAASKAPPTLEPELQLMVKSPTGFHHHAAYVAKDPAGRDYQMIVPLNTVIGLSVRSSAGNVFDHGNNQIKDTDSVIVRAAAPAALPQMIFTLHKKGN